MQRRPCSQARGRAILDRDKAAFLALIDPAASRFRAQQATVFARLVEGAVRRVRTAVRRARARALRRDQADALPEGRFIARVLARYTLEGADSPVEREQYLTLVPRDGDWLLATDEDTGGGAPSPEFGRTSGSSGRSPSFEGARRW